MRRFTVVGMATSTVREPQPRLLARDLAAWRQWLRVNHARQKIVWLVFFKGKASAGGVSYDDALDEALCWGWIDSLVKRLDEASYARKFTRRVDADKWSAVNIERLRRLLPEDRLQLAGRAVISTQVLEQASAKAPLAKAAPPPRVTPEVPEELTAALAQASAAATFFAALAPSHRRAYVLWVGSAKQEATRQRRAQQAVRLLAQGQKTLLK